MIIGISGKAGSGKDTIGKILQYLNYCNVSLSLRHPFHVLVIFPISKPSVVFSLDCIFGQQMNSRIVAGAAKTDQKFGQKISKFVRETTMPISSQIYSPNAKIPTRVQQRLSMFKIGTPLGFDDICRNHFGRRVSLVL